MTAFYFDSIPEYYLNKFIPVRTLFDNLYNILVIAEIINQHKYVELDPHNPQYDFIVYSGDYRRLFIKKSDGFSSMAIPFEIVENDGKISFNCDCISHSVDTFLISIFRNAIRTCEEADFSVESIIISLMENFSMEDLEATRFLDAFLTVINQDHGYFRYDDDPDNEDGDRHPRHHLDIFIKNTSTLKIGTNLIEGLDCFHSLCDKNVNKKYLRPNS